jgi:hypothetical protein
MTIKEKIKQIAIQLKVKLETQLKDFEPKYDYKFPNLSIEIGKLVFVIHLVHTEIKNPTYCLISIKSWLYFKRDFIVQVHISKEEHFRITGFCMEDDLEFYSKPSPYPNPDSPCYGIPICKLKNITNLTNIIKQKIINTSNNTIK